MCDKKRFTKREGQAALNQNKNNKGKWRKECRLYHCPDCNYWHLTSKP